MQDQHEQRDFLDVIRLQEPDAMPQAGEAVEAEYSTPDGDGDGGGPLSWFPLNMRPWMKKAIIIALLAVIALVSAFPASAHFSNPLTYQCTIEKLDSKRNVVLGLTATSAVASAGITALPGDTGSTVADRLMDLSQDLGIVLIAIYLEKYLLTFFGFLAFGVIVPVACLLLAIAVLIKRFPGARWGFISVSIKLLLMGAVLFATIPASVFVTDMIENTYHVSVSSDGTVSQDLSVAEESAEEPIEEEEGSGNFFADALDMLGDFVSDIGKAAGDALQAALDSVNSLIDGFAVMIVTTCLVPIGVLFFMMWAASLITGISLSGPMQALKPRTAANVRNDVRNLRGRAGKGASRGASKGKGSVVRSGGK